MLNNIISMSDYARLQATRIGNWNVYLLLTAVPWLPSEPNKVEREKKEKIALK